MEGQALRRVDGSERLRVPGQALPGRKKGVPIPLRGPSHALLGRKGGADRRTGVPHGAF